MTKQQWISRVLATQISEAMCVQQEFNLAKHEEEGAGAHKQPLGVSEAVVAVVIQPEEEDILQHVHLNMLAD